MSTQHLAVSIPQRRTAYEMSGDVRMGLILKGKLPVPTCEVGLRITNVVIGNRVMLGRFASPEQAVMFGWCGLLKHGKVTRDEILKLGAGRSGMMGLRHLNETQIIHLLSARSLITVWNQSKHEVSLYDIDASGFECEIDTNVLEQFR